MIEGASTSGWPEADLPHLARLIALGELTASIAHELSQPLTVITANGEAGLKWLDQPAPAVDRARANVTAIVGSAHRAVEIIRRLRGLAKRAGMDKSLLTLNDVIYDVVPLIEAEIRSHGVSLRLDLAAEPPLVLGDRIQLQQVLLNLLLNAMQAVAPVCDRRRELVIGSRRDPGQGVITVQDSGSGFDPRVGERLFDPFFTTRSDGIGIGLSICRLIVEAHDGRIWATRNRGHGATFQFALPLAP